MNSGVGSVYLGLSWVAGAPLPPSDQHKVIIGTKAVPDFSRKGNRALLHPPMSSGVTPLASYRVVAWSQWNTHYRAPVSNLS
ncbi:hypothetical protein TNCV_4650491 [Trichonephila clavipes]|nr:hypothetical protein TNCV_4650491 [Trichonephila clavipes]